MARPPRAVRPTRCVARMLSRDGVGDAPMLAVGYHGFRSQAKMGVLASPWRVSRASNRPPETEGFMNKIFVFSSSHS